MKKKNVKITQKDLDRIVSESIRKVVKKRKPLKEYFYFDSDDSNNMGYGDAVSKTGPLDWYDVFDANFMQNFTTKCQEAFGGGNPRMDNQVMNIVDRYMELLLDELNRTFRQ